jgi:hypothetical protein
MFEPQKPAKPEPEERRVIVLELLAATAIFSIVALVLFMVFSYRPV